MAILNDIEIKKGKGKMIYRIIVAVLIVGIPLQFLPYLWMVSNVFKFPMDIIKVPPSFMPEVINWNGFAETFSTYKLTDSFLNTLILVFGVILIQIPISAMSAFALSKLKPKYGKAILLLFLATTMISAQALMFPLYIMMVNMKLLNNFWSYILSCSAWGYAVFLFKGFFDGLPDDLLEAANIDGASDTRIFVSIILPLSKPVFAVNILSTFMSVYNDFMLPVMLLPDQKYWTIMMRIFNCQSDGTANPNNIFVMLTLATLPIIAIYIFSQKYITQGISFTGLKG